MENACYEVNFIPCDMSQEVIAIAKVDGHLAALGRLVRVTDDDA